jgi:hypothetical protein
MAGRIKMKGSRGFRKFRKKLEMLVRYPQARKKINESVMDTVRKQRQRVTGVYEPEKEETKNEEE